MSNKQVREALALLYGFRCMLTGIQTKDLSYHHITKKEHKGKATIENGSNLHPKIHEWFHNIVELKDKELFYLINECLMLYKKCLDLEKKELIDMYESEIMPIFRQKMFKYNEKLTKKKC